MANITRLYLAWLIATFLPSLSYANPGDYQVCFTPGGNCTELIVQQINSAKKNIWVQAYSFTSYPIGDALVAAQKRGVNVQVILDKSNFEPGVHTSAYYLIRHGIKVWDDNQLNIAHNKVMIFDSSVIETGSFNYTYAAQNDNAENVLIIYNPDLAKSYLNNWQKRQQQSTLIQSAYSNK
ncbi:MAG: phospholipase [Gammaproteobacteria bacterium]|jgi:phosphatidylserine/phosphatidylglycerophosphate/cardiolipin synthase-like enzyme|nr:phospholipase [Gammaproteobacteria bacterium]